MKLLYEKEMGVCLSICYSSINIFKKSSINKPKLRLILFEFSVLKHLFR